MLTHSAPLLLSYLWSVVWGLQLCLLKTHSEGEHAQKASVSALFYLKRQDLKIAPLCCLQTVCMSMGLSPSDADSVRRRSMCMLLFLC